MTTNRPATIFISAAEASGAMHAAKLIRALPEAVSNVRCVGLGGPAMAQAGCELLEDLVSRSAMLTHVVKQVGFYRTLLKRMRTYLAQHRPDVVVLVDSPAWNFHLAKVAKSLDIPVVYYIAPQLWAWGPWRIKKLRRLVDKVACILPFEEDWFRTRNVDATFVGHPLFDESKVSGTSSDESAAGAQGAPVVTLLPGSRKHELERLWPVMTAMAQGIRAKHPIAQFRAAASDDANATWMHQHLPADLNVAIDQIPIPSACTGADLTLVASGTATLEVAATGCPLMVLYQIPAWQWHLVGRWLIRTKYLSLVNILAGRELAPEYMPVLPPTDRLIAHANQLLADSTQRDQMRQELTTLMTPLKQPGASKRTAQIIADVLQNR